MTSEQKNLDRNEEQIQHNVASDDPFSRWWVREHHHKSQCLHSVEDRTVHTSSLQLKADTPWADEVPFMLLRISYGRNCVLCRAPSECLSLSASFKNHLLSAPRRAKFYSSGSEQVYPSPFLMYCFLLLRAKRNSPYAEQKKTSSRHQRRSVWVKTRLANRKPLAALFIFHILQASLLKQLRRNNWLLMIYSHDVNQLSYNKLCQYVCLFLILWKFRTEIQPVFLCLRAVGKIISTFRWRITEAPPANPLMSFWTYSIKNKNLCCWYWTGQKTESNVQHINREFF